MAIKMDGTSLTIEDVIKVARFNEKVELDKDAMERIRTCRNLLERKIDNCNSKDVYDDLHWPNVEVVTFQHNQKLLESK